MTDPLESLKAVLCDPDGRVCIDGSDGDRRVIQEALAALASERQKAALSAITNADEDDVTSERAKQAEPVAIGHDGKLWPHTIDAKAWADEFCKRNTATDNGTMIGWFANAIEFSRAYDAAPPAVQAEPAAWFSRGKDANFVTWDRELGEREKMTPLYAAPPAVQGEPLDPMPPIYPGKRSDYAAPPAVQPLASAIYKIAAKLAMGEPMRPLNAVLDTGKSPYQRTCNAAEEVADRLRVVAMHLRNAVDAAPPADDEAVRLLRLALTEGGMLNGAVIAAIDAYLAKQEKVK